MDKRLTLGLIGSTVLFVGVFTPIVQIPIVGSQNFFQNGHGDGVFIMVLALLSLLLAISARYRGLIFTGIASLAILAFTYLNFTTRIAQMREQMQQQLADNPFRGLAEGMMQGVQLQWGWAVLVVGAVLVLAAGVVKVPEPTASTPPVSTGSGAA